MTTFECNLEIPYRSNVAFEPDAMYIGSGDMVPWDHQTDPGSMKKSSEASDCQSGAIPSQSKSK